MKRKAANNNARCPICGAPVVEKYHPFCSARCADIDLGRWLKESYILPGDSEIPDDEEHRESEERL